MERGNKKVLKELSSSWSSPTGKRTDEHRVQVKAGGPTRSAHSWSLKTGHTTDQSKTCKKHRESDPGSPTQTAAPVPHCTRPRNNKSRMKKLKVFSRTDNVSSQGLGFLPDEALVPPNRGRHKSRY